MMQVVIGVGAGVFFIWLLIMPSSAKRSQPGEQDADAEHSRRVGAGTGLMGGDIEDAATARYALSRTAKDPDSSKERDLGTALGMQSQVEMPD